MLELEIYNTPTVVWTNGVPHLVLIPTANTLMAYMDIPEPAELPDDPNILSHYTERWVQVDTDVVVKFGRHDLVERKKLVKITGKGEERKVTPVHPLLRRPTRASSKSSPVAMSRSSSSARTRSPTTP